MDSVCFLRKIFLSKTNVFLSILGNFLFLLCLSNFFLNFLCAVVDCLVQYYSGIFTKHNRHLENVINLCKKTSVNADNSNHSSATYVK